MFPQARREPHKSSSVPGIPGSLLEAGPAFDTVTQGMRKPRRLVPGAEYHVIARVNRSEFILETPAVKEMMMTVLSQAKERYGFRLANYCVMSNHLHLIIAPADGSSLSRIMQWVLSVFAIRYNRRYGLRGHVWYDRFHSNVIAGLRRWLETFDYIGDNPVKAGVSRRAGDYPWSGLRELRTRVFRLLDPQDVRWALFPRPPEE